MKKFLVIFMILFLSKAAFANPVIVFDPIGSMSFIIVVGSYRSGRGGLWRR